MSKIIRVIRMAGKDKPSAVVFVQLDDGSEAQVWIGGECEVYFHMGVIKAFVKKGRPKA